MGRKFLKLPQNDRFHYTPRYYKGAEEGNIYKMKSRYRKDDQALNYNDYRGQWSEARKNYRSRSNYGVSLRLIIIIAVLTFLFLYIIDFDLSIFQNN
jgi:hypothetical protein